MNHMTFKVSAVHVPQGPMTALCRETAIASLCRRGKVEQHYLSTARMVRCDDVHPFVQAAHDAFYRHYPLTLTPDAVWFCIAQGFAHHVNLHAESLRHAFVSHKGQLTLTVTRLDFQFGQYNPWPEAFGEFSQQIAAHIGPAHRLLVADFSTTGPVERAASEVLLMDAFKPYFKYEMIMGCGIPAITLAGTREDWVSIRKRAAVLAEYGLQDWLTVLLPVLDKLVETASGRPDLEFWRSFYRHQSSSGLSELTGWITVLFPYLKGSWGPAKMEWNPNLASWLGAWSRARARSESAPFQDGLAGVSEGQIPSALNSAPVRITDVGSGTTSYVQFVGGMFGVVQDAKTLSLSPEFGWAVLHGTADAGENVPEADPFSLF